MIRTMDEAKQDTIEDVVLTETSESEEVAPIRVVLDPTTPSIRSIVRVVVVAAILIFIFERIAAVVGSLTYLFFLLVLSVFLAYLIDPLVRLVRKPFKDRKIERFMPRPLAIATAYVFVFTVTGLTIAGIAPNAAEQAREFGASIPSYVSSAQRALSDVNRRFERLRVPDEVQAKINEQAVALGEQITTGVGGFLISSVTFLPWIIIIPILSFFFLKDVNIFRLAVLRLFPAGRWRIRADSILSDANTTLAAYARAQLISCILIGTVCTIAFYLIGLKYALLLGIMAGIFEFVPLLGPLVIGVIATTTAALGSDPRRGIYVAVFLIAFRIIHDYVTYPRIVRGGLHLHPVMIILSVLAGEQIAGIPGVFLAIPFVALVTVAYKHFLEHQGSRTLFEGLVQHDDESGQESA